MHGTISSVRRSGGGLTNLVIRDENRTRSFRYHARRAVSALGLPMGIPHEVGHLMSTRTQLEKWDSSKYDLVRDRLGLSAIDFEAKLQRIRYIDPSLKSYLDFVVRIWRSSRRDRDHTW